LSGGGVVARFPSRHLFCFFDGVCFCNCFISPLFSPLKLISYAQAKNGRDDHIRCVPLQPHIEFCRWFKTEIHSGSALPETVMGILRINLGR